MAATIIKFPLDRCRVAASVLLEAERATFDQALTDHAQDSEHVLPVTAIMRLGCNGVCPVTKRDARAWLFKWCNVHVADDDPGLSEPPANAT